VIQGREPQSWFITSRRSGFETGQPKREAEEVALQKVRLQGLPR
jgi:hypothetical protein